MKSSLQRGKKLFRYRVASLLVLAMGVVLSAAAFVAMHASEQDVVRAAFEKAALNRAAVIKSALDRSVETVSFVAALFDSADSVERWEFRVFTERMLATSPGVQALEWIPRVSSAARDDYENAARAAFPNFQIQERDNQGAIRRAGARPEYFPVYYVEPYVGYQAALGFDLGSNPITAEGLAEARDSGKLVAKERIALVKETGHEYGFVVIVPIYNRRVSLETPAQRHDNLRGFTLGVYRLGDVIEAGLHALQPSGIDIALYDGGPAAQQRLLYFHRSRKQTASASSAAPPSMEHTDRLLYAQPLLVGQRSWTLLLSPAAGQYSAASWRAWAMLIGGILLSMLLAAYLEARRKREKELANRLDDLAKYANDIIMLTDERGNIVEANDRACRAYGHSHEELLRMNARSLRAPEWQQEVDQKMQGLGNDGVMYESVEVRKDGSTFPVEVSVSAITIRGKRFVQSITRDITERKRSEAALRKVHRALRVLSECNMALVRAGDERALLDSICRNIVETGGYCLAWVGYAYHDEAKSIQPVAHFGMDRDYVEGLHLSWGDDPLRRGVGGAAVREGRYIVARHIATDPVFAPWREEAGKRNFASCIAFPLKGKTEVLGMLSIYAAEPDAFDTEEVKLLEELANDLAYGIVNLRDAEARARFQQQLDYQSQYDVLTGLANRSLFNDRLRQATIHAGRAGRLLGVVMVNLDRFKVINDTLGHEVGDALLKHVAERLTESVREGDTVARLSGDEFAVLLTDIAEEEEASALACKLLAAFSQPLVLDQREAYVSASVGMCLCPKDGEDAVSLLTNAGAAMSKAKALGGNTLRFYAPEMNDRSAARLAMETDLRRALERKEISLHYQPKVDLATGEITGAEALMRWYHPERGLLPSGEFIQLAEETGLIQPLGEWVIESACQQLRRWLDAGVTVPRVAVNLSARQFRHENLARLIQQSLSDNALDPSLLELEITESTVMEDITAAIDTLSQLKALGVTLSLDDFGTGYSSLSCMKRLPIDNLKIDQSFVRDLTTDSDDAAICTTVIGLAHNLKLGVVAEGVETEGQMAYLRRHNCDEMQGYYFSRPLPANEFVQLLAAGKTLELPKPEEQRPTILLVDDEELILAALKRLLRRDGYRILTANSGAQALELLAENDVDVIVSDQRMPAMTGIEFLRRAKEMHPDSIRIVLSGYTELQTVTDAVNEGAIYKFLTKPWDDGQLREHIEEACRRKGLADDNRRLQHELQLANGRLQELLNEHGHLPRLATS